ncbi:glycoside hydrolase family 2 protein [Microvirga aerilata]|uniref:glycoside hydrolase family 2 protein n=1 Tax=Microvirga aerilata TaxID=670292 RepID=UPI00363C5171
MTLVYKAFALETAARPTAGQRAILSLDGAWDFQVEGEDALRVARVPAPWQALFDDMRHATGTALYRKRFTLPQDWAGRQIAVCFGAVNHLAEVSLDGRPVGTHEGGYLPFEFVLGTDLQGEHELEVRVTLPSSEADLYPDAPFPEVPHGKQSWYGPLGGIWQSVRLEARSVQHVTRGAITSDLATGNVRVRVSLAGSPQADLTATVYAPNGTVAAQAKSAVAGQSETEMAFRIDAPAAWSPDEPNLYRLHLQLGKREDVLDSWSDSFGFRTIAAKDGRILLNGKPLYLRGALDQDYYPDGICTPPSLEFLEDQLLKAKSFGLNCLRIHIKVPDPRYYEVADRLGMLVWTELPNFDHFTPAAGERAKETLKGILERDFNHPSIIAWTIINEDWGTQLPEDEDHRRWLADMYDWMKALDPTRLVVDNSPCQPNFHVKSDVNDYHYYRCLPERRAEWDALTEEFANAAPWTYSNHGDSQQTGKEPLLVSEFGVWGLPHPNKLMNEDGSEPWWMETGQSWGDGAAYPHGLKERFNVLRLDRVFGNFEKFVDATQWHQFTNLKYEIESMRSYSSISGYVLTELTDVHWEANGLMDMRRNPRVFQERFAEVNTDLVIVPKVERWAYWCGETIEIAPSIAAGMVVLPEGCTLEWSLEEHSDSGRLAVKAAESMSVQVLDKIIIAAPELSAPAQLVFAFTLLDASGAELARNSLEVSAYPRLKVDASLRVWSVHEEILGHLTGLGYSAASSAGEADVVVVRSVDAEDVEAIRRGGRYLMFAGDDPDQKFIRRDEPPMQPLHAR